MQPNLRDGAEAWILAGGAHHTGFSYIVTPEHLRDFAEMTGIECVIIDKTVKCKKESRNRCQKSDL